MSIRQRRLHFCVAGGRIIFLDIQRNRYFALPSRQDAAFLSLVGGRSMGTIATTDLATLDETRFPTSPSGIEAASTQISPPAAPTSDRMAQLAATKAPGWLVVIALLTAIIAKFLVRFCPLRIIIARLEAGRRASNDRSDPASVDVIAQAFRRTGLFVKSDGNCLPLTLAFTWLCRRFGHQPRLIIGVRVNPFSAHCWSQSGTMVLNDALERVRLYQPILVL